MKTAYLRTYEGINISVLSCLSACAFVRGSQLTLSLVCGYSDIGSLSLSLSLREEG